MTQAFNLSQLANFVNTSGQLNAASGLYNQTGVANGGTGKSSVTAGALLIGAGTSAMVEVTGTTANQLLVSSPTGWTASPSVSVAGGNYVLNQYTSPTTWTKPATLKAIKVTVIGGGGNGGNGAASGTPTVYWTGGSGGGGGGSIYYAPASAIPGPIAITAGSGTNSFGAIASATAGANGANCAPTGPFGTNGAGGSGSGGTINISGSGGLNAISMPSGSINIGGGSALGAGSARNVFINAPVSITTGTAGNPYGGGATGGKGSTGPTGAGGAGAPGIVIVEEFY